jgi:protein-tyrosine-phosphatase
VEGEDMAMRITRGNVESLKEALEALEEFVELKDDMESWLENQDEPRTEDIAEELRASRENFEDRLDEIRDACQNVIDVLGTPFFPPKRKRATAATSSR